MGENKKFELDKALGFFVNRAAYLMTDSVENVFAEHGFAVSAQDFAILNRLSGEGLMTQARLGQLMMRDKTTITRRLDGLAKKGLIERVENPKDRRSFNIQLTKQGVDTLDSILPLASGFQSELLDGLNLEQKEQTIQTLEFIIKKLMGQRDAKGARK